MDLPTFLTDLDIAPLEYHRLSMEWEKHMREAQSLFYDEQSQSYIVFSFEEVVRVQKEWQTFSSEFRVGKNNSPASIISMDPPDHTKLRSLVSKVFSARAIQQNEARVMQIVEATLAPLLHEGEFDLMGQFANPLPVMALLEILGLPYERWYQFKEWTEELISKGPEASGAQQLIQVLVQEIEARIRVPREDMLTMLIQAEVDGVKLSFPELITFCFTLFIANNITTTNDVIGNAFLCFHQYPEALEELYQNPDLIPGAVEEVLRYMPPFRDAVASQLLAKTKGTVFAGLLVPGGRITVKDTVLAGQPVAAGSFVRVNHLSANFDQQKFVEPERFNIHRSPNPYQTFGHGIHFCIGGPLARLEVKVVLQVMLERMKHIRIIDVNALKQKDSMIVFGAEKLPIRFESVAHKSIAYS
jgi:cytochrome P450